MRPMYDAGRVLGTDDDDCRFGQSTGRLTLPKERVVLCSSTSGSRSPAPVHPVTSSPVLTVWVSQYVFDAAPMFIVALLYTVYPPGEYVSMRWRQPRSEEAINRADSGNNMDPESFALSPPGRG